MKYQVYSLLTAAFLAMSSVAAQAGIADGVIPDTADIEAVPPMDPMDPNSPGFSPPIERSAPAVLMSAEVVEIAEPAAHDIPSIHTQNESYSHADVTFVTGGIGDNERQAIEAARADYNLHVMSANIDGAFVGDARAVITRKKGNGTEEMLSVVAGPLLYVRLPAGTYTLTATLGGQVRKQSFTVAARGKSTHVHLGWNVDAESAR